MIVAARSMRTLGLRTLCPRMICLRPPPLRTVYPSGSTIKTRVEQRVSLEVQSPILVQRRASYCFPIVSAEEQSSCLRKKLTGKCSRSGYCLGTNQSTARQRNFWKRSKPYVHEQACTSVWTNRSLTEAPGVEDTLRQTCELQSPALFFQK